MIPHQAVINIRLTGEIYERLPSGKVVKPKKKINKSKILTVVGDTFEECEAKAVELIKRVMDNE